MVPQLSTLSYQYNAIHTGDTVTLFSMKITLKRGCFNDVKLYDNKEFANCGSGLNGGDFLRVLPWEVYNCMWET
ncbi:MAG: hypothetical protein IPK25_06085 [Saprospiraceae bacterium]|nr:hypothetical protein [Saprospiraceae bacterium]